MVHNFSEFSRMQAESAWRLFFVLQQLGLHYTKQVSDEKCDYWTESKYCRWQSSRVYWGTSHTHGATPQTFHVPCVSVRHTGEPTKMDEPIEMPFWRQTHVGPKNHVSGGWGARFRHLANTTKESVRGGDASSCQITFTTSCYRVNPLCRHHDVTAESRIVLQKHCDAGQLTTPHNLYSRRKSLQCKWESRLVHSTKTELNWTRDCEFQCGRPCWELNEHLTVLVLLQPIKTKYGRDADARNQ